MSRSWRWEREEGRAAWQREKHMQGPEARAWPAHCAAGIWTRLPVEGREQEVRGGGGQDDGAVLPEMLMAFSF